MKVNRFCNASRAWMATTRFTTRSLALAGAMLFAGSAAAAPEIKTIKPDGTGDYTTLASWWAAVKDSTNPEQWAEVYSGGSAGDFSWSGMPNATTTGTAHPRIYAASGHRHAGRIPVDPDTVARCGKIAPANDCHRFTIEGMYVYKVNDYAITFGTITGSNKAGPYFIRNCLIRRTISNDTAGGAFHAAMYGDRTFNLHNNIFLVDGSLSKPSTAAVVSGYGGNRGLRGEFYHNTIITALPMRGIGSPTYNASGTYYNNVVLVGNSAFDGVGGTASHNASSDDTADTVLGGTDNLIDLVAAAQFVDSASDWNLTALADLRDTGNPSPVLATDAVGNPRPQGTTADIGALEWYPSADPTFWIQHPVTSSQTHTGTNELTVVEFHGSVGYTHYQITDSATPPVGGTWKDLAADAPETVTFQPPAVDGPVTLYAWFTNTSETVEIEMISNSFIYTIVPPVAEPQNLEYYMSLSPATIHVLHLDNGSTSGQYGGEDIGFYSLEMTCDGDPDTEPGLPGITLDTPGTYTFHLTAINMAGNTDSQSATVTILPANPEIATIKPDGTGDYTTLQAWWDAVKGSKNPAQWAEVHSGGSVGSLSWSAMPNLVAPNTVADAEAYPMIYGAEGQRHEGRLPKIPDTVARCGRLSIGSGNHRVVVEGMYVAATNTIPVEMGSSGSINGPITLRQSLIRRTITDDTAGPAIYWALYQIRTLNLLNNLILVDGELSEPSTWALVHGGADRPLSGTFYHNTIITALPMRGIRSDPHSAVGNYHNNAVFTGGDAFVVPNPATASHNASSDDTADTVLGGTDNLIDLVAAAQFVDPAADWRYLHTSSLIDAGLPALVLDVDAVGNSRPNGVAPEIGALEHWPPPMETLLIIR